MTLEHSKQSPREQRGSHEYHLEFASSLEMLQEAPILALALTFPERGTPDNVTIKNARANITKLRQQFADVDRTTLSTKELAEIAGFFVKSSGIERTADLGSIIVSLISAKTLQDSVSVSEHIEGCVVADQRSFYRITLMKIAKSTENAAGHTSAFQFVRLGGDPTPVSPKTNE
jgi:hypothetical protein